MITRVLNEELEGMQRDKFVAYLRDYPSMCVQIREKPQRTSYDYPLSYRVPVRKRYGSTLLPATREQHDQNCTQSH